MKLTLSLLCDVTFFLQKKTFKTILSSRIKGNKKEWKGKKRKKFSIGKPNSLKNLNTKENVQFP